MRQQHGDIIASKMAKWGLLYPSVLLQGCLAMTLINMWRGALQVVLGVMLTLCTIDENRSGFRGRIKDMGLR